MTTDSDEGPSEEAIQMLERQRRQVEQRKKEGRDKKPPETKRILDKTVTVLGARGVGKTALSRRIAFNVAPAQEYSPTIEDTWRVQIEVDGVKHDLTLLDTAGQTDRTQLNASYLIGVDAFVLMFNVTSLQSFEVVKVINSRLMHDMAAPTEYGMNYMPRVLVGNHKDRLVGGRPRHVSREQAEAFARAQGVPYFEISALTDSREVVQEPVNEVVRVAYNNWLNRGRGEYDPDNPELSSTGDLASLCLPGRAGAVVARPPASAQRYPAAAAGEGAAGIPSGPARPRRRGTQDESSSESVPCAANAAVSSARRESKVADSRNANGDGKGERRNGRPADNRDRESDRKDKDNGGLPCVVM